ncbi:hypothetical protein NQZ79_g1499 [Umbelopsis isabellina]|nr:hypothetical protein NQZ79_g1499 [Umbelopsis isabellina]
MDSDFNATACQALQGPKIQPIWISETAVYSFDALTYLYFILAFLLVPYPVYRIVANAFKWEVNQKTLARHWSDLMLGLSYGCIVFVFGNYSKAFSLLRQLDHRRCVLSINIRICSDSRASFYKNIASAYKVVAHRVILAFAAFHIYLAVELPMPFVIYYVCALAIPVFFILTAVALVYESTHNIFNSQVFRIKSAFSSKKARDSDEEQSDNENSRPKSPQPLTSGANAGESSAPNPVNYKVLTPVALHLHHWQIFYVLCFFTRFDHPVSQVAAGIVLACYMQGICAYGYDPLVNDV